MAPQLRGYSAPVMGVSVPQVSVMRSAIGTKRLLQTQSCYLLKGGFLPLDRLGSQQRLSMRLTLFETTFDKLRKVLRCVFFAKKTISASKNTTRSSTLLEKQQKNHVNAPFFGKIMHLNNVQTVKVGSPRVFGSPSCDIAGLTEERAVRSQRKAILGRVGRKNLLHTASTVLKQVFRDALSLKDLCIDFGT